MKMLLIRLISLFAILSFNSCENLFELKIEESEDKIIFGLLEVGKKPIFIIQQPTILLEEIQSNRICDASVKVNSVSSTVVSNFGGCTYTQDLSVKPKTTYKTEIKIGDKSISNNLTSVDSISFPIFSSTEPRFTSSNSSGTNFSYRQSFKLSTMGINAKNLYAGLRAIDTANIWEANVVSADYMVNELSIIDRQFDFLSDRLVKLLPDREMNLEAVYLTKRRNIPLTVEFFIISLDDTIVEYLRKSKDIKSTIRDPFLTPLVSFTNLEGATGFIGSYSKAVKLMKLELK
jgi:hypothetical protein